MGFWGWTTQNWFNLFSAFGIIGGFLFTGHSLRLETKSRRVANVIALTANHRELWAELYGRPQLTRILEASVDVMREPVTRDEEIFVNMMIQHVNAVFLAMQNGLVIKPEGARRDVWWLFSLPIPKAVWEKTKILQNDDFVAFVEACRNWK